MQTIALKGIGQEPAKSEGVPSRVKNIIAKAAATARRIAEKNEKAMLALAALASAAAIIGAGMECDTLTGSSSLIAFGFLLPSLTEKGGES